MTRDSALAAVMMYGWSVFPCGTATGGHGHPPGSHPDCARCRAEKAPRRGWRWQSHRTANPAVVRKHWPADGPNLGIACGPSRLVVVDLDTPAHGADLPDQWRRSGVHEGADVLACLLEEHGQGWPATHTVMTASRGMHLYFQAVPGRPIPNSVNRVGPMIDVRGDGNSDGTPGGGYVLGAGSSVGGTRYETIDDSPPIALPDWLANLADTRPPPRPRPDPAATGAAPPRPRARFVGLLDTLLTAPVGQRNSILYWTACRAAELVRPGDLDEASVVTALTVAATSIGLTDREASATIGSAFGRVRA